MRQHFLTFNGSYQCTSVLAVRLFSNPLLRALFQSFLFITSSVSGRYDRNMSSYFIPDIAFPDEINYRGNKKKICCLPSSVTALS